MSGLWKGAEIVLFREQGWVLLTGAMAALALRERIVAWLNGERDQRADDASVAAWERKSKALGRG